MFRMDELSTGLFCDWRAHTDHGTEFSDVGDWSTTQSTDPDRLLFQINLIVDLSQLFH